MRSLVLLLFGAAWAFAQPFSAGVRGGLPLTDFLNAAGSVRTSGIDSFTTHTNRYIIGVTGELHLPFGFGVEVDALYRHLNYQNTTSIVGITTTFANSNTTGNAWEFPLLAKYRFPSKVVRPYVVAGIAWDTLQGLKQAITKGIIAVPATTTSTTSSPAELNQNTTRGFVTGVGVDVHALVVHLQPELRYTRWGARHFLDTNGLLHSNQNQAEFLLGITF